MPRHENILTVFVASPINVGAERTRLEEVINELNQTWSRSLGIRLDLVRWETHAHPEFGIDSQDVINKQIPEDYDIFIGIMWDRFGTPTGRAESGTHEEFTRAKTRWEQDNSSVNLMIYFKEDAVSPSQTDAIQLGKVQEFRNSLSKDGGLYWTFEGTENFVNLVRVHLTRVVQEWQKRLLPNAGVAVPSGGSVAAMDSVTAEFAELTDDLGLIELSEVATDCFAEAGEITLRMARDITAFGKKLETQTNRAKTLATAGKRSPSSIKKIVSSTSLHMKEFAFKIGLELPGLNELMKNGLDAISKMISLLPEPGIGGGPQDDLAASIQGLEVLGSQLTLLAQQIDDFRRKVESAPNMSVEFNRAKRAMSTALQSMINLLRGHRQAAAQIEKSAREILAARDAAQSIGPNNDLSASLGTGQTPRDAC